MVGRVFSFFGLMMFGFVLPVGAVIQESGYLRIEHDAPIFSSSQVWFPGKYLTKSVLVTNLNTVETYQVGLRMSITDDSPLTDVLWLLVRYGADTLWEGSFRDLVEAGEIALTSIGPGGSVAYDLTVFMDSSLGNEYQNKTTVVDFTFGFLVSPTPTVTPTPTSTTTAAPMGGVGETVSVCNATAPGPPQNLTAISGETGEIILSWSPPSEGVVTHYLIAYGTTSGNYIYGNPNVGNVTSYTVSGLSSGTTYYFVVKGINDCAPGPFSNEVAALAGGERGALVAEGPPVGFEVLGRKQEAAEEGELGGGIATVGGEAAGVKIEKKFFWWWVILALFATVGLWLGVKRRQRRK